MGWEKNVKGYFFEREGFSTLGDDAGFIAYKDLGDGTFYVRDLYVDPDFREKNHAFVLAERFVALAKEAGAYKFFGTVAPLDPGADRNIKILQGYGMKFSGMNELGQLIFSKEI
jgi:GNAT superfamily N-acetyltransferase